MPRILLVDDDPVSLRFLAGAIAQPGVELACAADAASALREARLHDMHLLLIDRNLPDCSGEALLRALRAAGVAAPAIATSAELDDASRRALRDAGFVEVLAKPAPITLIRACVGRHVPLATLDDDAAARSSGSIETATALRPMLAVEIRQLLAALDANDMDAQTLAARLHRLRAACGFCGASALGAAAQALQSSLEADARTPLAAFHAACQQTLRALER